MTAKQVNFPTQDWIDEYIDAWLEQHPTEKVEDFKALEDEASQVWWDREIEKGNPTPFDLSKEQEKASKDARMGIKSKEFVKRKEPVKRERKANEEKRALIELLCSALESAHHDEENPDVENISISNVEKSIDFTVGENSYSFTLTCHRKPKK